MCHHGLCNNSNPSNIPIFGAFDFETAFPSVIHKWIWAVLRHRKLPESFITFFISIYKNACAIFKKGDSIIILIQIFIFTFISFLFWYSNYCFFISCLFNHLFIISLYLILFFINQFPIKKVKNIFSNNLTSHRIFMSIKAGSKTFT